jgi:hypothetical protein
MNQKGRRILTIGAAALLLAGIWGVYAWRSQNRDPREKLLSLLPEDAGAVVYVDLVALRQSPFLAELYRWAPQPAEDPEYAQFVGDTGFHYERDLDRVAIALAAGTPRRFFVVADGRFDTKKISAYALRSGTQRKFAGRNVYRIPPSAGRQETITLFLGDSEIALMNDWPAAEEAAAGKTGIKDGDWDARFARVAGSPLFAVIRQEAAAGNAIVEQAPGGLRSPQLASLLNQLQWISLAAKPQGQRLQVVGDGECPAEETARQLADFLNGVLVLAQAGLNDPKMKAQMDENSRRAYLDLLKSVDIQRLDRGESKSVRVVFEIAPELLALATTPTKEAPPAASAEARATKKNPGKPLASKAPRTQ